MEILQWWRQGSNDPCVESDKFKSNTGMQASDKLPVTKKATKFSE
jgi:hypothetical protein